MILAPYQSWIAASSSTYNLLDQWIVLRILKGNYIDCLTTNSATLYISWAMSSSSAISKLHAMHGRLLKISPALGWGVLRHNEIIRVYIFKTMCSDKCRRMCRLVKNKSDDALGYRFKAGTVGMRPMKKAPGGKCKVYHTPNPTRLTR